MVGGGVLGYAGSFAWYLFHGSMDLTDMFDGIFIIGGGTVAGIVGGGLIGAAV
jgi:hypothetical protein